MIDIDVKIDAHEVMDSLTGLQQDVVPEAAKLALNRAVKQVRTAGVRKISKKLNLPSKFVRKRLAHGRFDRASNKVLRAKVYLIAYDVNAIEFKGIITKSGSVAERIKMQSGWKPKKTASGNTSTGDNVRKTENRIGSRRVKKSGGVRKRTYAHVGGRRIKKGAKLPDGRDFKKAFIVKVEDKKNKERAKNYEGNFVIFQRTSEERYPIKRVKVDVSETMEITVENEMVKTGPPAYEKRFQHEFNRLLSRKGLI